MGSHIFNGLLLRQPMKSETTMSLSNKRTLLPPIEPAPPNTPSKGVRKRVTFPDIGGMPGTLRWGGRADDRETIHKHKSPQLTYKLPDNTAVTRPVKHEKPDSSIYNLSWVPNAGLTGDAHIHGWESLAEQKERWTPMRTSRGSADGLLYSRSPSFSGKEESGSSSARLPNSRTLMKLKRPGCLETLNAADRAVSFIQKKQSKEEQDFETILAYHHSRYDRLTKDSKSCALVTERSEDEEDTETPEPAGQKHLDWRTKISKRVREQYADLIRKNETSVGNRVFRRNREYYKDSEHSLAVGIDLKRYHHAI